MLSNFDANDLVAYRGDDFGIQLEFLDTEDVPINITGWTIFLTIKRTKDNGDVSASLKMDTTSIPSPELGKILITVPSTVTYQLTGSYWYDIQVKKTDDTIQTITTGNISFEKDVTRRTIPV